LRDGIADNFRRLQARLSNDPAILSSVAAVDALHGQIDDGIRCFKLFSPLADCLAIPFDGLPWHISRSATENDNFVATLVKCASERGTQLTRTTRNYDLHLAPTNSRRRG